MTNQQNHEFKHATSCLAVCIAKKSLADNPPPKKLRPKYCRTQIVRDRLNIKILQEVERTLKADALTTTLSDLIEEKTSKKHRGPVTINLL